MLQQDSSDCNDVYNIVNGTITVKAYDNRGIKNRLLAFKNNTLFISSIFKINNVLIDNAKDLDVEMSMYNLIEYSKNYIKTPGSLQKSRTGSFMDYYRDESSDDSNENNNFASVILIVPLVGESSRTAGLSPCTAVTSFLYACNDTICRLS